MPRLIHLNGPSRVGKSTLARRYADDHPGCLRLDLDELTGLVGGWRRDLSAALDMVRPLGWAMATRHLQGGHDVIVPQLVTSHDQAPGPDTAAYAANADYVELALLVNEIEHVERLSAKEPTNPVELEIQRLLDNLEPTS